MSFFSSSHNYISACKEGCRTASADIVPIGELSAVDTALLEVVPSPFADVADASVVAPGSAPVCPPELLPSAAPDGVTVTSARPELIYS